MNYEGFDYGAEENFMMPPDYHERYGALYSGVVPDFSGGMGHVPMYPDIYYRIHPYVSQVCDRMDNPYMLYPSEAQVESMINECYDQCVRAMPDLYTYPDIKEGEGAEASQIIRRRPLLRDLIGILLVAELFRRRRRRYPYWYGYSF